MQCGGGCVLLYHFDGSPWLRRFGSIGNWQAPPIKFVQTGDHTPIRRGVSIAWAAIGRVPRQEWLSAH